MKIPFTHRRLRFFLQAILLFGAAGAAWKQQWLTSLLTLGITGVTFAPLVLGKRFRVIIPPEMELLAITFVFAALFLGEIRGYYVRYWWWDVALHTASGFLLGISGFLLVHVLNEKEEIDVHMKPGFVALFAFMFAVGIGAIWEIFEFGMDTLFGFNMQKEMFGDPSGLTDTMWDLIVDSLGALLISVLGFGYLKTTGNNSFLERWIDDFIRNNPRFFKQDS